MFPVALMEVRVSPMIVIGLHHRYVSVTVTLAP